MSASHLPGKPSARGVSGAQLEGIELWSPAPGSPAGLWGNVVVGVAGVTPTLGSDWFFVVFKVPLARAEPWDVATGGPTPLGRSRGSAGWA